MGVCPAPFATSSPAPARRSAAVILVCPSARPVRRGGECAKEMNARDHTPRELFARKVAKRMPMFFITVPFPAPREGNLRRKVAHFLIYSPVLTEHVPSMALTWSAVSPVRFLASTLAPASIKRFTILKPERRLRRMMRTKIRKTDWQGRKYQPQVGCWRPQYAEHCRPQHFLAARLLPEP